MSLQDRLSQQDSLSVLVAGSSLALCTAASVTGASYNFPLMLFGITTHEMHSSTQPLRQFLNLLLFSAIFDLYTLLTHSLHGFVLLISFLLLLAKAPIFFSCLAQLRERGGDLQWAQGGWGLPQNVNLPGRGAGWSMPGAGGGADTHSNSGAGPPGGFPSSGGFRLGGEEDGEEHSQQPQAPPGPPPAGRGGYQTIA